MLSIERVCHRVENRSNETQVPRVHRDRISYVPLRVITFLHVSSILKIHPQYNMEMRRKNSGGKI